MLPSLPVSQIELPPSRVCLNCTDPLTTATSGVPAGLIMSTPSCDRPPDLAAPHVSPNAFGPLTGQLNDPVTGAGFGAGTGAGAVVCGEGALVVGADVGWGVPPLPDDPPSPEPPDTGAVMVAGGAAAVVVAVVAVVVADCCAVFVAAAAAAAAF